MTGGHDTKIYWPLSLSGSGHDESNLFILKTRVRMLGVLPPLSSLPLMSRRLGNTARQELPRASSNQSLRG